VSPLADDVDPAPDPDAAEPKPAAGAAVKAVVDGVAEVAVPALPVPKVVPKDGAGVVPAAVLGAPKDGAGAEAAAAPKPEDGATGVDVPAAGAPKDGAAAAPEEAGAAAPKESPGAAAVVAADPKLGAGPGAAKPKLGVAPSLLLLPVAVPNPAKPLISLQSLSFGRVVLKDNGITDL